jgi:3-phenylpropionate/trans-cinnamate dioxygenase ferredoxin reductase component
MFKDHFVVIGNGPAGNQAALTLKQRVPEAAVTLISKEHETCYKPHLLPDLIAGKTAEEALCVCPISSYREKGIQLRTGQTVVGLNLPLREVILDHMEIVRFTGLVIAVGGKPRIPEPLLVFRDHMFTLKTLDDAKVWIEKLSSVNTILIMGGDLTSFAVAKALLSMGKKVYFMLNEDAFWPLRSSEAMFGEVLQKLAARGVETLPQKRLKGIARVAPDAYEVQIDGNKIRAGMIGAFFGLIPDVRFLTGSGLRIDRGILVDEYLNAGFEGVYATGDCAQIYHRAIRDYWVSIGHDNAVNLGRTAALNLVGGRVEAGVAKESIFEVQGVKLNTSWWTEF